MLKILSTFIIGGLLTLSIPSVVNCVNGEEDKLIRGIKCDLEHGFLNSSHHLHMYNMTDTTDSKLLTKVQIYKDSTTNNEVMLKQTANRKVNMVLLNAELINGKIKRTEIDTISMTVQEAKIFRTMLDLHIKSISSK